MKRVKIMLFTICLVAVAGGVLAFKTMTEGNWCTIAAIEVEGAKTCPATLACPNFTATVTEPTDATLGNVTCVVQAPNPNTTIASHRCRITTLPGSPVINCAAKANLVE